MLDTKYNSPQELDLQRFKLNGSEIGCDTWWQEVKRIGTPLTTPVDKDTKRLTFLWRDPDGDQYQSAIQKVYIDVYSVTDHHQLDITSLTRIADTDVWYWQVDVESSMQASYFLVPCTEKHLLKHQEQENIKLAHRRWWRQLIQSRAMSDPLNNSPSHASSWGGELSSFNLSPIWLDELWSSDAIAKIRDRASKRTKIINWSSRTLQKNRQVWLYSTAKGDGGKHSSLPLVILLDGEYWAQQLPISTVLQDLTNNGKLVAANYLFIDAIDGFTRNQELACDQQFWQAVEAELLPMLEELHGVHHEPEQTLLVGQSLGGLAAVYATLKQPTLARKAISISGSFWWPDYELASKRGRLDPVQTNIGTISQMLTQNKQQALPIQAYLSVGKYEDMMIDVNEQVAAGLRHHQVPVTQALFNGGHDWICWRNEIIHGLIALLSPDSNKQEYNHE